MDGFKMLRYGFRAEIGQLHLALIDAAPGEARKPIFAEIRQLKKLISRADKVIAAVTSPPRHPTC